MQVVGIITDIKKNYDGCREALVTSLGGEIYEVLLDNLDEYSYWIGKCIVFDADVMSEYDKEGIEDLFVWPEAIQIDGLNEDQIITNPIVYIGRQSV